MRSWTKLAPLGEVGEIVSGATPRTEVAEYWNGDIPWITPADLTGHEGIYFSGNLRKITQAGYKSTSTRLLPAGSILFSSRAPIGHCAVTTYPLCTNQGFKSIVPGKNLDTIYGYFALKFVTPEIIARGRGATFLEVTKEIIEEIQIPLPPLTEQRRIAAILARADRLRRLRRYALELSAGYLQAVFVEMFGDPVTNPRGWETHLLGKHLSFTTSGSRGWAKYYSESGDRFIQSYDVRMNDLENSKNTFVTPPQTAETRRTVVKPGDVLVTITGSKIGCVASVPEAIGKAYVSQHVAILRPSTSINSTFLSMFLSLEGGGQLQINKLQYGQSKPGLNFEQLHSIKLPFPPFPLQERFAAIARRHERLRGQQREALRQAEGLFAALLSRAFRGELVLQRRFTAARADAQGAASDGTDTPDGWPPASTGALPAPRRHRTSHVA